MDGAAVQPMVTNGVECLVGVVSDPTFGPLIAFGLGGVLAEVVGDVAFRVHPLTDVDADELIASVKASRLPHGFQATGLDAGSPGGAGSRGRVGAPERARQETIYVRTCRAGATVAC